MTIHLLPALLSGMSTCLRVAAKQRDDEHAIALLYQGRFKSFPVQDDGHFLTVCRYVEANALRAAMVERAEDWPYGGLSARSAGRVNCRSANGR
jgi:REP element-mobilizing transposase RayT